MNNKCEHYVMRTVSICYMQQIKIKIYILLN